jgi:hypothetical protein
MRTGGVPAVPSNGVSTELRTPPARRKAIEHPGRFAIVAGGLTIVALLFAGAITSADTSNVKTTLPKTVESISPQPGTIVPPEEPIVVDLRDDLTADLELCGPTQSSGSCTALPADQVEFVPGLGQLTYRPGEGKEVQAYEPGRNTVVVHYYSQADPERDTGLFSWSFVSKS